MTTDNVQSSAPKQKFFSSTAWRKAFSAAFPHTLPVLMGFSCLGLTYGFLMQSKGYGPLYATLMSAIAFCGSMQYVAITLLTIAFNPVQAFLLSLMVNARHLFYGLALLPKYRGIQKIRPFLIYTLCDETFSIVCAAEPPSGMEPGLFYGAISFLNYGYWVVATLVGGILGSFMSFDTSGLDFVLTALFVVLFMEQWRQKENRLPAVIGVVCTLACLLLLGAEQFIIPAMLCILATLLGGRKRLCP